MNIRKAKLCIYITGMLLPLMVSCSSTKFVGNDEYLLNRVQVISDTRKLKPAELEPYIKQKPNQRVFGIYKMPLHLYSLSGRKDNSLNKFIRKVGEAPVVYDAQLVAKSMDELKKVAENKGYLFAKIDTVVNYKKKKADITYVITGGAPLKINSFDREIKDQAMDSVLIDAKIKYAIKPGMILDNGMLEDERMKITNSLRNNGYFGVNKDLFSFYADTTQSSQNINLLLKDQGRTDKTETAYLRYKIRNVLIDTAFDPMLNEETSSDFKMDTIRYKHLEIVESKGDRWIKPVYLSDACFIQPGEMYSEAMVNATYAAFSRLPVIRFVNIRFEPVAEGSDELNCIISLSKSKSQGFSVELDGTNSAGDLGAALGFTYKHSNLFKGSEVLSLKVRGAYEQLSGSSITDNYTEYGGEATIGFPRFLFPFLRSNFKKKLKATTEFGLQYNYQHRPEYERVIAGTSWRYKWTMGEMHRHTFDFIDFSYTYLPWMSEEFRNEMDQSGMNPVLRYSYENHFIMRMGYTYYRSNTHLKNSTTPIRYSFRGGLESAGNMLYAISSLMNAKKVNGGYELLGIRYAQYVKGDVDYAMNYRIDKRNYIAWHVGFGIAYPYGNLTVIPYEKRYFAGGANSVRAWGVRTLGPGRYVNNSTGIDFMNQSGDIKLDLNVEYRSYLFWKLHGALFVDAGNIWTIRKYENQPGGQFQFDKFYKEIALGYGVGVRADFDYFVLRLDLGIKAYDPALTGKEAWRFVRPRLKQDFTLNFAVGYPF